MDRYAYKSGAESAEIAVQKQKTIDALTNYYSRDQLTMDEYETRVEKAQKAQNIHELSNLVSEFEKPIPTQNTQFTNNTNLTYPIKNTDSENVFCVMSGRKLSGSRLSNGVNAFTIMGGVTLDFRNTALPPGETLIDVFTVMGGIDIIVPPGLAVQSNVLAIMGGTDIKHNVKSEPYPGEPCLVISGVAIMAGVEVKVRN